MELGKRQTTFRFYHKVKTGCLTCKRRKLKCDEAKPHCHRCTRTGRKCEGYRPGSRRLALVGMPASATHPGLFTSQAERRSFFFFQSQASTSLGGYFNSSFWGREVMQAAIHYPAIRHLLFALGTAYETFEAGVPAQETLFILQQCNHSIRQLVTSIRTLDAASVEGTCCILTASVLFVYLASIQGHFTEAFYHVQFGVRVLQAFERVLAPRGTIPTLAFPVPVSHLRSLVVSAYGQLRAMVDDVTPEAGCPDVLVSDLKPTTIFTSLQEAHSYVEGLFHNTLAFLQETALHPQHDPNQLEATVARHRDLCRALESSEEALDAFRQCSSEARDAQRVVQQGIAILQVYHLIVAIRLRIDIFRPGERESAFNDLEAHLEEILRLCESVANQENQGSTKRISCSSGLGYVMPLHMVPARCRNSCLRRRAMQLLLSCSRREGVWDAHLAGRIVSQTIGMEEQAALLTQGEETLGDRRIREVKLELQGEKSAALRFITVEDRKHGRVGTRKLIQW